ncbi:MAG: SPL family radical SAM protein [Bacteroidia bacterium]
MPQDIRVKSVLNKTKGRDPWFLDDYTLNPYSGCSFNCLYCYIRGSKYGTHMEQKLSVKINAPEVLERQLYNRAKKNQYGFIVLSSATDPYLQFEKEKKLTRQFLELILKYKFPVHIITKSDLVIRDLDLLQKINETSILPRDLQPVLKHKALITFSFSTIDEQVAGIFEPGATSPLKRIEALTETVKAGFHSGVSLMPLLPFISDKGDRLEEMFDVIKKSGARYIFPATLTLFGNDPPDSKTLILRAIEKHYPELLARYQKFFSTANSLPAYYVEAFHKKMEELYKKYGIKNSIL